jgi:adenylate cyclase
MSVLAEYQSRVVPIVLKHSGSIDKFMGDGILAHFGAFSQSESCAADSLRAAIEIDASLQEWVRDRARRGYRPFGYGMGIAGGTLIFGAVGETDRLEFTVIGAPVNLSAKLEKHTKRAGARILTTQSLYDTAISQGFSTHVSVEALPEETVDGISGSIALARIAGEPSRGSLVT